MSVENIRFLIHRIAAPFLIAPALLSAALWNGFPLIFPDSGTYLLIAFDRFYAIDRSSFYGLFLKPFVTLVPGMAGLWVAVAVQAAIIASVLVIAVRHMAPATRASIWLAAVIAITLVTPLPWHAGQFMPDAFTGALILLTWAASLRDPSDHGAPLLWCAASFLALAHYTHLPLMLVAGTAAILVQSHCGVDWRGMRRRLAALGLCVVLTAGALVAANGAALGRWSVAPMGPVFLFARLHSAGLVSPWLDRHCGRDAPAPLCGIRGALPRDSQALLWNADTSPLYGRVFHTDPARRWRWVDRLAQANTGAIAEAPLAFAASAMNAASRQFVSFAALDDECPAGCRDAHSGITYVLSRYRPSTLEKLKESRQVTDRTAKSFFRKLTTAVGGLSLLLLPLAAWRMWTRRDAIALPLVAAIAAALAANACIVGSFSGVHDRYQSRLIWLAPFALALIALRQRQDRSPGAARAISAPAGDAA